MSIMEHKEEEHNKIKSTTEMTQSIIATTIIS